MNDDADAENAERQNAELEFVEAAYAPDEAWCIRNQNDNNNNNKGALSHSAIVHRRLRVDNGSVGWVLRLFVPRHLYPQGGAVLQVEGSVDDSNNHNAVPPSRKAAFQALDALLRQCRQQAEASSGEEAVFGVLSAAEEWIQQECESYEEGEDKSDGGAGKWQSGY